MKPSKELFYLIQSLTKSEKRYFKLMSSLQTGDKNYMKLFDCIEGMEDYDEEEVKEKLKGEKFIKHLPSEKNHLYKLILKSLRSFYSDNSAASILQENLRNIELLFNKALYAECFKHIQRAKAIAYSYEKFYFLLDLIDWEKKLIEEAFLDNKFKVNMESLIEEETDCLEKLRNIAEYQKLYSKINFIIRKSGFARNIEGSDEIKNIANHPLIVKKGTAHSIKAATACLSIKGLCAVTEQNLKVAYENFSRVVKIMEDNPSIMQELPKRYIRALNSLMYVHLGKGEWKETFELIDKMKSLSSKQAFQSMDIQLKLFSIPFNAELNVYIRMRDYSKAAKIVIPKVIEGLQRFRGKINKEEEMLFYYNIARIYFFTDDLKNALRYINLVLNESKPGLRDDVYSFARLVNLVIHFELNNIELLEYNIKSTKRFLTVSKRDFKLETVFLTEMRKLVKSKNLEKQKAQFINFRENLLKVFKEHPNEKIALDYFNFILWLDSKIQNKSYTKLLMEQAPSNKH